MGRNSILIASLVVAGVLSLLFAVLSPAKRKLGGLGFAGESGVIQSVVARLINPDLESDPSHSDHGDLRKQARVTFNRTHHPNDTSVIDYIHASYKPNEQVTVESLEALLDDTLSTKLTPQGQIDWSHYDSIEFYHTRKAGGTSLFQWAKKVAQKHGLTFHQQEGTTYDPRDHRYVQHKVFVFTSLRPPVERVLSSYEYDSVQTDLANGRVPISLREFYDRSNEVNNHGKNQKQVYTGRGRGRGRGKKKKPKGWVWKCATECYSKWFGGWPTADLEVDTFKALERLNPMEVVWMKNLDQLGYMQWLRHRWNATDIPLTHQRKTKDKAHQNYTDWELELLNDSNQNDQCLYEAMRRKWTTITNMTLV